MSRYEMQIQETGEYYDRLIGEVEKQDPNVLSSIAARHGERSEGA